MQEIPLAEAKTIGRKKALKATAVIVLIQLIVLFLQDTHGDFANGILFFVYNFITLSTLLVLTGLFILTAVFGGLAGKEIICSRENYMITGIKYGIVMSLISYCGVALFLFSNIPDFFERTLSNIVTTFLWPLAKAIAWTSLLYIAAWLFATYRIKVAFLRLRSGQAKRATSL